MRNTAALILWICLGLFLCRVLGQIEVLLTAPLWLPPMEAWYSGLLPYTVLLPAQVLILMLMATVTFDRSFGPGITRLRRPGQRSWLRVIALAYFAIMALRLLIECMKYGGDFYLHGAIPVAFHWVLALYLLVLVRPPFSASDS